MAKYINKAAVVAEIDSIEYETNYEPFTDEVFGKRKVCKDIKDFINTLEVKEVDDTLEVKNENSKKDLKGIVNGAMNSAEKSLNKTNDKSDYICYKIFKYLKENM